MSFSPRLRRHRAALLLSTAAATWLAAADYEWGLGLMGTVNGNTTLLHDGRARDAAEAILWHGGEATVSREAFRAMPKADREALLRFLASL